MSTQDLADALCDKYHPLINSAIQEMGLLFVINEKGKGEVQGQPAPGLLLQAASWACKHPHQPMMPVMAASSEGAALGARLGSRSGPRGMSISWGLSEVSLWAEQKDDCRCWPEPIAQHSYSHSRLNP